MGTPATYFNEREQQICLGAQLRTGVNDETSR